MDERLIPAPPPAAPFDATPDSPFISRLRAMAVEPVLHAVFNEGNYLDALAQDIKNAHARVIIQSAYFTPSGVQRLSVPLEHASRRGVRICVFVQQPSEWDRLRDPTAHPGIIAKLQQKTTAIEYLKAMRVHVTLRKKIHEKLVVIDDAIFWEGSLNVLSHYDTLERLTRWLSRNKVAEGCIAHQLGTCGECILRSAQTQTGLSLARWLGAELADQRKKLGLTQEELALVIGAKQHTISCVEKGDSLSALLKVEAMLRALGLQIRILPDHMIPMVDETLCTYKKAP